MITAKGLAARISAKTGSAVTWSRLRPDGAGSWNYKFTDEEADAIEKRFVGLSSGAGEVAGVRNPRRGDRG